MKSVDAQFVPAALPSRRLWVLVAAVAALACASLVWAWGARQALSERQRAIEQAETQRRADVPPARLLALPAPYERSANEMLQERQQPWPEALTALEAVVVPGVTPRALELLASEGVVRVELVAADHSKVLTYLQALNAGSDEGADSLKWSLQQAQMEGADAQTVAVIIGRRAGSRGIK